MMASTRLRPQHEHSARAAGPKAVKSPAESAPQTIAKRQRKAVAASVSGWGVYILRCADTTLYTGCTNDRDRRLGAHGKGQVKYTRGRLPVAIVFWQSCADKSAALRKEAALKRLSRRAKLALCG